MLSILPICQLRSENFPLSHGSVGYRANIAHFATPGIGHRHGNHFLMPRTLLYFPMVALTTGTAGWFLASWLGFINPAYSRYESIIASPVLVVVMIVLGLGFLLPNSLRTWFEFRKAEPDSERINLINKINIWLAGSQGVMQIAIIAVMARLVI